MDDKAKAPFVITAAKKQGPILMRLEYKVRLPDHDFVKGGRQRLTPSVYAGLVIKDKLSYSGPTYIAVRSGKHDSSTSPRHFDDLIRLLQLPEFQAVVNASDQTHPQPRPSTSTMPAQKTIKPVLILLVDGGPDQGPRHVKTLKYISLLFKKCDLDALSVATNAPWRSAYNPVERRTAPLSKDLCGLILPHDAFGSHLDKNGKTVDSALEERNFQKAGELLADVWSETVIDGYPVTAEFVLPGSNTRRKLIHDETENKSHSQLTYDQKKSEDEKLDNPSWCSKHIRQSQYMLQIVKCGDIKCCAPVSTNIPIILQDQFLPAPIRIIQSGGGVKEGTLTEGDFCGLTTRITLNSILSHKIDCFDKFCPSVQTRMGNPDFNCNECGLYFTTKTARKAHHSLHSRKAFAKKQNHEELIEDEEKGTEMLEIVEEDGVYLINDLDEWWEPLFEEETSAQ